MSPRPYRLGLRQASTDQTRSRIIDAARELILTSSGFAGFTVEAVARLANVARMTVYYQFGSKLGLVEALFDDLATRGGIEQLPQAFMRANPLESLDAFIEAFSLFWAADRLVLRRVRSLAALDSELGTALHARDERRRLGFQFIVPGLLQSQERPADPTSKDVQDRIDVLFTLTSFETFDSLAGEDRSRKEVTATLQHLARLVLDIHSE